MKKRTFEVEVPDILQNLTSEQLETVEEIGTKCCHKQHEADTDSLCLGFILSGLFLFVINHFRK